MQELKGNGATYLDYVSKNTYLCYYQNEDLSQLRQLGSIVYVCFYPTDLKTAPDLKEVDQSETIKVDIVYHNGVDPNSSDLQGDLSKRSHCESENIEFLPNKARLTTKRLHLDDVALIDDVRCIEDVGTVVAYNDVARQVLELDSQSSGQTQQIYQGENQIIAVADSGLEHARQKNHS